MEVTGFCEEARPMALPLTETQRAEREAAVASVRTCSEARVFC